MNTVADRIFEADRTENLTRTKEQILKWDAKKRDELIRYLAQTQQIDLLKEFFGIASLEVLQQEISIILPKEATIYLPQSRDTGGMIMSQLSKKELSLLLQAFFPETHRREYLIDLMFYQNAFLKNDLTDVLDVMQQTEKLITQCVTTKKNVLRLVQNQEPEVLISAANDNHFTPLVDRIEDLEPGYFHYLHEAYRLRLHYVESLFCATVAALAEVPENQFWAVDPANFPFIFPEKLKSQCDLIGSICDFHVTFDPHFPQLHTAIEPTVAAWILIYKGYGAPAEKIRSALNHPPKTPGTH
ncbi:MAG: hypothetical protein PHU93_04005 [Candidatus Gracilibacteria bacterium]|nr:hypothetical protein [Candidatus Gracilibacteria bacterium]